MVSTLREIDPPPLPTALAGLHQVDEVVYALVVTDNIIKTQLRVYDAGGGVCVLHQWRHSPPHIPPRCRGKRNKGLAQRGLTNRHCPIMQDCLYRQSMLSLISKMTYVPIPSLYSIARLLINNG